MRGGVGSLLNVTPVQPSIPRSLYPFFLESCLRILSKVFRSSTKPPILEVEWIRCGSLKIQRGWNILSPEFQPYNKHKVFRCSTLYKTIPHDKLKSRLASIIQNFFIFKNGDRRYKYLVLGHKEHILLRNTLTQKASTLKITSSRCSRFS